MFYVFVWYCRSAIFKYTGSCRGDEQCWHKQYSIGDYIRLGNYNGQPILWRCVDVDEMGPLMLSDQVLATMAYDAKTSENSATRSHSRNLKRGTYGSNQWRDSNMRSWLIPRRKPGR